MYTAKVIVLIFIAESAPSASKAILPDTIEPRILVIVASRLNNIAIDTLCATGYFNGFIKTYRQLLELK